MERRRHLCSCWSSSIAMCCGRCGSIPNSRMYATRRRHPLRISLCYRLRRTFETSSTGLRLMMFSVYLMHMTAPQPPPPPHSPATPSTQPPSATGASATPPPLSPSQSFVTPVPPSPMSRTASTLGGGAPAARPRLLQLQRKFNNRSLERPDPNSIKRLHEQCLRILRVSDWPLCFDYLYVVRLTPSQLESRLKTAIGNSAAVGYHDRESIRPRYGPGSAAEEKKGYPLTKEGGEYRCCPPLQVPTLHTLRRPRHLHRRRHRLRALFSRRHCRGGRRLVVLALDPSQLRPILSDTAVSAERLYADMRVIVGPNSHGPH